MSVRRPHLRGRKINTLPSSCLEVALLATRRSSSVFPSFDQIFNSGSYTTVRGVPRAIVVVFLQVPLRVQALVAVAPDLDLVVRRLVVLVLGRLLAGAHIDKRGRGACTDWYREDDSWMAVGREGV